MENKTQKKQIGKYILANKIGQGQFGVVDRAVEVTDFSKVYAVKCINKTSFATDPLLFNLLKTEIRVMQKVKHPNIMHLYEVVESKNFYYLVMDFCDGGDLAKHINKHGKFIEKQAVYFLEQIMNAFRKLHDFKIMHRDIKLENMFLKGDKILIGDFGFAKEGSDIAKTRLGTPITMAPEVLDSEWKSYTNKTDLWSIGIIYYQMLFDKPPFGALTIEQLKDQMKGSSGAKISYPSGVEISTQSMDLISGLLQIDPLHRISWKQFFQHPLFDLYGDKPQKLCNINDSVLYRENQEQVRKEFLLNKERNFETIPEEAEENEHIDENLLTSKVTEETPKDKDLQTLKREEKFEQNLATIKIIFVHEKRLATFMVLTSKEFKNMSKKKTELSPFSTRFMALAYVLGRKGIIILERSLNSLDADYNAFELLDFKRFCETENKKSTIDILKTDFDMFTVYNTRILKDLKKEPLKSDVLKKVEDSEKIQYYDMDSLNVIIKEFFDFFVDKIGNTNLSPSTELTMKLLIIHLYYCLYDESALAFSKDGKLFDWTNFRFETNQTTIDRLWKSLIKL